MRHFWLRELVGRVFGLSRRRKGKVTQRQRAERQPVIETLETRLVPSTFLVTDTSDSATDTNSLRYAITNLATGSSASTNTINFSLPLGSTITLSNGALTINQGVTINGPGVGALSINGNNASQVFVISSGISASISAMTITGGSTSNFGGGIDNAGGTLTVSDSTFSNNTATTGGGGIYSNGTLTVTDSTFTGNSGGNYGGGGILATGSATVGGSTFVNNSSTNGGGGGIDINGTLTVANSTFTGNIGSNSYGGGGILVYAGTVTISDSTIVNNSSPGGSGGGLQNGGTTTLTNDIIAGNSNGDLDGSNVTGSSSFNLIGTGGSDGLTDGTNGNQVGVSSVGLGSLADNGGPTETIALMSGSPAIGAGTQVNGITTDQRGVVRPPNHPDVGAYQTDFVVTTNADSGAGSLRSAITSANSYGGGIITFDPSLSSDTITLSSALPALLATVTVDLSGDDIALAGGVLTGSGSITNGAASGTATLTENGTGTFSGVIQDGSTAQVALTVAGGTVTLSGASTYSGATTINGGDLQLSNTPLSPNSTSVAIASGATLEYADSSFVTQQENASLTLTGTGTVLKTGAAEAIFGYGGGNIYWQLGAGALIDVEAGTLKGGDSADDVWTNNLSDLNVAFGATFEGSEANVRVNALTGAGTVATGWPSPYITFTVGVNNGGGTFSGVIEDEEILRPDVPTAIGNITKVGTGTETFSGTNTYTGTTTVTGGLLQVSGSIASTSISVTSPGAFNALVVSTADSGAGTLRQAIAETNDVSGVGPTITFSSLFNTTQTITLTSGELDLTDSVTTTISGPGANLLSVSGNNASRVFGINSGASAAISGLTITGGRSVGAGDLGKGAAVFNSGTVALSNATLSGNTANGSVLDNKGTATLTNSTISGNTGGGANNDFGTSLTLSNTTVSNNTGFGVSSTSGPLNLTNCTVSGNTAGGVFLYLARLSLTNCTVSGNSVAGIILRDETTAVNNTLTNCTVTGNTVGIVNSSPYSSRVSIENSIVAGNTRATNPDLDTLLTLTDLGHNLFGTALSGSATGTGDVFTNTPGLAALASNGGPTQTMALLTGSPAINAGNSADAPATDQRGLARFGNTDIGAYEAQFKVYTTADSGTGSLRQAVVNANTGGPNTVVFSSLFNTAQLINLTSAVLTLTNSNTTTIGGPGANLLTIHGNNTFGIFSISSGASAAISGMTITGGSAAQGGGIFNNGTATLSGLTVSGNTANAAKGGGGIANYGTLTLTASTLSGNTAPSRGGGGITNAYSGVATLTDVTISGNTSGSGAGVESDGGNGGGVGLTMTLTDCTISGNTATQFGGGGVFTVRGGTLTLLNCTVSGNTSTAPQSQYSTGGIVQSIGNTLRLENTIVAGNTGSAAPGADTAGALTSLGNNLIGNRGSTTGWLASDQTGTTVSPLNAQLGSLASNGGTMQTIALLPTSPAINAGNSADAPATDQRGLTRFGNTDIGAFEYQFKVTTTANSGTGSLRQAITNANTTAGTDTVVFRIGSGAQTISPTAALPTVTDTIVIDGTTQTGFAGTPLIQISGTSAGSVDGLTLGAGSNGSTIKGLILSNFSSTSAFGIRLTSTNNIIQGNWIGLDTTGNAAAGNFHGIALSSNNLIGTDGDGVNDAAERNVISGNSNDGLVANGGSNNKIAGNYIGTNAAGNAPVTNNVANVFITNAVGNIVGTDGSNDAFNADERNVINGGIIVDGNTVIAGNYIGLNAAGTAALSAVANVGIQFGNSTAGARIGTNADGIADAAERNVISGINGPAIIVPSGSSLVIAGNYIGTNPAGTAAIPNQRGIQLTSSASGVRIGTNADGVNDAAEGNLISGNTVAGVQIGSTSNGNVVAGNTIGLNAAGTAAIANGVGVLINSGSSNNTVGGAAAGAGNVIAFNSTDGVQVDGATTTGNAIRGNSIHDNAGPGIHLTNGGNNNQAAPVLQAFTPGSSTVLSGNFGSTAGVTITLDAYANAVASQGAIYLGGQQVTTGAGGAFIITLPGATLANQFVSATATSVSGSTSQFAADVTPNTNPGVTITAPGHAVAGAPVSLTSTLSDTTKNKTYIYAWTVTQTGNPAFALPASAITNEPSLVFIPPTFGTYVAHLVVTDSLGGSGATASLNLLVSVPGPSVVIQGTPGNLIAANTTVSLTSTVTSPTGATPTSYTWGVTLNNGGSYSLPSGTPIHGTSFAFTPSANGLYQISLTVSDSAGGTTTTSVFVTVAASGQAATIYNVPRTGSEGTQIVVKGAGNPNLTGAYAYNWAVYKNGAASPFFAAPADSTGSFAFTPDAPGLYQVTLVITDSLTHIAAAFPITIPVGAVAPTAQVLSFPTTAVVGQVLTLAGTATSAGAADPVLGLTWTVTSSNGQVTAAGAGPTLNYTPSVAGTNVVTLTAVTASGARGSKSVLIVVAGATTLSVSAPSPLLEGTAGQLTAQVNNPHSGTYVFVWTVIEQRNGASLSGTTTGTSPTSNFNFTPPVPGAYLVTVNATDTSDNTTVSSGTLTFQAADVAPTVQSISVSPTAPSEGAPVTLIAAVIDPGLPIDVLHYRWTVTGPDGFLLNAVDSAPKFTPKESGSYTAKLTVTDSSGAQSAQVSKTFTVAHVTPTLAIQTTAGTGVSGSTLTANLTALLNGDPNYYEATRGSTTYTWTVSPTPLSSSANRANFTFTGNATTSYRATVTVTDTDGDNLTAVASFLVYNTGTTKTLTSSDVPSGATQIVAISQGSSKIDASAVTVPVTIAAVGTGHDTLMGGAGSSVLMGDSGNNSLVAGSGPTTLIATQGDTLVGGTGSNLFALMPGAGEVVRASTTNLNNTLSFAPSATGVMVNLSAGVAQFGTGTGAVPVTLSGSFQSLLGGSGNDTLMAGSASNVMIQAGSGNALLSAGSGTSVSLFGGTGNDSLSSSGGTSVSLVGGGGNDTLSSSGGTSITMFGGTGNDSLSSTGGTAVTIMGGDGNSTLSSSGGTSITMFGGTGNDSLSSSGGTSVSLVSGGGNDTLSSSGGTSITMFGGTGNDSLSSTGGTGVTLVSGGGGNDTLTSSGGTSITMFGGTGNDSLSSTGGTSVSLVSGGGDSTLSSSGGSSITMFGGTGNDSLSSTGGTGVTLVSGGGGNDTLSSSGGTSITMFGGTGNDSLSSSGGTSVSMVSGGGNDTLTSSGGTSITMFGGTGNDSLSSTGGTGVTLVSGGGGNDTLTSSGGTSITMFGGTGNDSLSSSGGTSVSMVSGAGNTTLSSSGGTSITMFGGTGNDSLSSTGGSNVTLVAGGGNDSLSSSGDSNALLLGGSSVTLFGGTGNDTLSSTGGTGITLVGGTGNDSLSSSGGSSITMFGGTGNDTLSSSGGTSVSMVGGAGNSTISSSGGSSITMFGGSGNDSLSSTGSTGVTMVGGTGNSTLSANGSSDALLQTNSGTGTTGVATVTGGTSITMFGGAGNDTLSSSGGTSVTMVAGSGSDTLSSTDGTGVLIQGGVVIVTQTGGSSITMFGGTGNDSLSSSGGTSVTIIGGSGTDTLSSSGGTSVTMFGGTGNDSLSSSGGTSVSIIGGTGNDTLISTGGSSITMFGGTGNDSLATSGGTSVTMIGGSGDSTLSSSGGSSITMFGGTGNDSLSSSGGTGVSMVGGDGNSTLSSSGGTSITLFGGTGDDSLSSSGGTSITMVGGTGNSTLASSGGTSVTMFGGTGNDSLSSSGGSSVTMIGGTGNDTLTSTGDTSITLFGGTGNDSLSSSGGTGVSVIGGSGNDTLSSTGGTNVTLQGGGAGNDSLTSSGGSSVTMFGGSGNDTLSANGGTGIGLYGLEGNNVYNIVGPITVALNDLGTFGQQQAQTDSLTPGINTIAFPGLTTGITLDLSNTSPGPAPQLPTDPGQPQTVAPGITLSLTGQFQNVVGTPGDDWIHGGSGNNLLDGGGSGNDTLVAGTGPATLFAGSGNDSLVAGTGGTTFRFAGAPGSLGNITVDPPSGNVLNVLDFSQFAGPLSLSLASTGWQTVSGGSGLSLNLSQPSTINAVLGTTTTDANGRPFDNTILGNSSGDTFYVGTGNTTLTGGGGADTFFFSGSKFGSDSVTETSAGNTLNFYGLAAPVNLNLQQAQANVAQPVSGSLTLTLSDPSKYGTIVGTPYSDVLVGNETADQTIIGGGGGDSLMAGNGNDLLQGNITQVVYLDFTSTPSGDHLYTAPEQAAILQGLQQIYADFNYFFTLDPAVAQQQAYATGGQYVTIEFNAGNAGGASNVLDPSNLDLGGKTVVNINPFLGDASAGLVPPTSANIVGLTTTIAAHELGHQSGLQHQDAFGPIGSGIYSGVNPDEFFPAFSGPTNATETPFDIMSSPASVGTTLLDAAQVYGPTYLGARDAIKLAFNDSGTVLPQSGLNLDPVSQHGGPSDIANAYYVPVSGGSDAAITLPALAVPNTLAPGARDYGKTLAVTAVAINGTLKTNTQEDFYAFSGQAGQLMNFQVISNNDTLNPNPIIPELVLVGPDGQVLGYNVHEFESADSTLLDITLPTTGTYYVGVDSLLGLTAGNYQLFMYSYAAVTGPTAAGGDTFVGGSGNDTILGSSANDVITFASGSVGNATVNAGSGQDIVNLYSAPNKAVTLIGAVTTLTQPFTPTVQVTVTGGTANGSPIAAVTTVTVPGSTGNVNLGGASPTLAYTTATGTPLPGAPTSPGTYKVVVTVPGSAGYNPVTTTSTFTITQATPVVTWATPAAITYGTALSATQLDASASVAGTFTYATPAGTVLTAGTHTLSVTFTPTDATDFAAVTQTVQLVVTKATPIITWGNPGAITYGTALSGTQLNATASVAGTFVYATPIGTVLGAGTQTLSLTFTPTDSTDYNAVTQTAQLLVTKATPVVTWGNPGAITYGPALSGTQLNATASVAGTFVYTSPIGTVLGAGTQTLSVTFTPTDATDYTTATKTVQLVVNKATPTVTWATPSAITYGTALSATQLNASAPVAGTFVYGPAVGTVLTAGTQTLSVSFIPNDSIDYNAVTQTVPLVVNKATPIVIWNNLGAISYGTPLSSTQLNAHATVLGTFVYNPAAGTILGTGTQTLSTTFTPTDTTNYTTTTQTAQLLVNNADLTTGTSVFVLSPNAAGALTLSGNAQLNMAAGMVNVDSSSSSAISVSGNAQVSAGNIMVVGGVQKSGNAKFSTSPVTGAVTFVDPLANLPVPSVSGTVSSVNLSGNGTQTINPGIFSQIIVSGNGKLTMNPGIYVIAGGGFSVTGNGSVSGSGVMIYNAGSNYLGSGNSFGVVNLSGNGNISLTAPTTGTYAGILIFQSHDNISTVAFSGNGITMPGGVVYAPAAALTMSGNGQFKGSLVVKTLALSSNAIAQLTASDGVTAVYSPDQVRTAYGINNLSLDGTGQTIAIVDAYDNPAIYQALDAFDAEFGLTSSGSTLDQLYGPASSFLTVVNQRGETTSLPATDPAGAGANNWEMEAALDVEWAHATAPGARIILVEADSQSLSDLMTAVATAAQQPGVSVVSMSWGFVEGLDVLAADEAAYDSYFTTPAGHTGVTFVASTGDYGAAVPLYPAMSPNVVAIGGTSLTLNADDSYQSEAGWGAYSNSMGVFLGSGGGLSQYEAEPDYQQGVQSTGSRTGPDVSLLADPSLGAWIADPYNLSGDNPWEIVGGTSLSTPAWSGLFALVNQGRAAAGSATLGSAGPTEAQTALYGLSQADYHDITSGSNGYNAEPGYDLVSGLGSPVADLMVPDLVAYAGGSPSSTPVAPITSDGLVLSSEVGSVSDSVAALTRAAALRVFSAQTITGASAPVEIGLRPGEAPKVGLNVAPGVAGFAGRIAASEGGPRNGSSPSVSGAPTWSMVLLDTSSALMDGAPRPETPAYRGTDVPVGGPGNDPLGGGPRRDSAVRALDTLMAGGWAVVNTPSGDDAGSAPGFGDSDDYFLRMSQGDDGASTDTDDI